MARKYKDSSSLLQYVDSDSQKKKCIVDIHSKLIDEHYRGPRLFNDEVCLDLDKYEKLIHSKRQNPSVDFLVALENDWLLLVEAKLNVESITAKLAKEITDKYVKSRRLIRCDSYVHEVNSLPILLHDSNFQQNRRKLMAYLKENPIYAPMKVSEFREIYF